MLRMTGVDMAGFNIAGVNVRPAVPADAARIAAIYNVAIEERASTFETTPRTEADMARKIADNARHPTLVAHHDSHGVIGWAAITAYRPRECYAGVGEFSIYLDRAARGQGIGRHLLDALVREAAALGYWKLLSRVFPFNAASLALCRRCGFREVGVYERHGRLDGRWIDVVIVERLILENQPDSSVGGLA